MLVFILRTTVHCTLYIVYTVIQILLYPAEEYRYLPSFTLLICCTDNFFKDPNIYYFTKSVLKLYGSLCSVPVQ